MDFLVTGLSVALCLGLFVGGFFAGRKVRGVREGEPSAKCPDEEETRRLQAEQDAYQRMMNYSVETAYGLNRERMSV